jgi:6-pyruvoyl tetrahydropterin synthase/QueD family protein
MSVVIIAGKNKLSSWLLQARNIENVLPFTLNLIRISKEFTFEMAHALVSYDGKCAGLHGHSYHLTVTILGKIMNETAGPRQGMVMDFSEIKEIVHEEVLKVYDHAVVLNEEDPLCAVMRRNGIAECFMVA